MSNVREYVISSIREKLNVPEDIEITFEVEKKEIKVTLKRKNEEGMVVIVGEELIGEEEVTDSIGTWLPNLIEILEYHLIQHAFENIHHA